MRIALENSLEEEAEEMGVLLLVLDEETQPKKDLTYLLSPHWVGSGKKKEGSEMNAAEM